MKAAILQQPRKFAVADRPVPGVEAGEVVVRIAATAVCHTDLDMYLGHHPSDGTGADVVIDTVGGAGTLQAGIEMLRPGGRFISFSLGHADFSGLSAFGLYFKEISIIGARALTHVDMAPSIELAASGKIDMSVFVTARYPLDQVAAAFEEYGHNPSRILRIVIDAGVDQPLAL
jgi:threonine dehydrogenase-like Zn-dependent dehydrogenase